MLQFIYPGNIRKFTAQRLLNLLAFKATVDVVEMVAQGNVIYFHQAYIMGRVQTADKAESLCLG